MFNGIFTMPDPARLGMKAASIAAKPVGKVFGNDRKAFAFLFLASVGLYAAGLQDAAIMVSVYSAMFGHSGIASLRESKREGVSGQDAGQLEDIENMMDDALNMAEDFQQKNKGGEK